MEEEEEKNIKISEKLFIFCCFLLFLCVGKTAFDKKTDEEDSRRLATAPFWFS